MGTTEQGDSKKSKKMHKDVHKSQFLKVNLMIHSSRLTPALWNHIINEVSLVCVKELDGGIRKTLFLRAP